MRSRRASESRKGVAMMEFAMCLIFLTPLLLGTFVFGFRLIRSLQMIQITRDLGHMYVRGVNFRNAGPIANAQTLANGYNLSSSGTSVVYLSQFKVIQQSDCDAAGTAPAGTACTNLGKTVFTEQLTIGNSSVGTCPFGTPPLQGDSTVSTANQANNTAAVATGFSAVLSLNAGETAYLAEMFNQTPDLNVPGFSGRPQVYARAIF